MPINQVNDDDDDDDDDDADDDADDDNLNNHVRGIHSLHLQTSTLRIILDHRFDHFTITVTLRG